MSRALDKLAFDNQFAEIEHRYNSRIVTFTKAAKAGMIAVINFKFDLSAYPRAKIWVYDGVPEKKHPRIKAVSVVEGHMDIPVEFSNGVRPKVSFDNATVVYAVNAFQSGGFCIGTGVSGKNANLVTIFDNLFRALIYDPDPGVTRFASPANSDAIAWMRQRIDSTETLPTLSPDLLFSRLSAPIPRSAQAARTTAGSSCRPVLSTPVPRS